MTAYPEVWQPQIQQDTAQRGGWPRQDRAATHPSCTIDDTTSALARQQEVETQMHADQKGYTRIECGLRVQSLLSRKHREFSDAAATVRTRPWLPHSADR